MKLKKRTKFALLFLLGSLVGNAQEGRTQLVHVSGCQSAGIRYGKGTKNKYDVGLTYAYVFNQKMSLLVELDHEEAEFGHSEFTNYLLLSPGVEYNLWNPAKWVYWHASGGASVGYDQWEAPIVDDETAGFVYGANVGTGFEFLPWSCLSVVVKAQQFLLFGNDDQYLKPNFSVGLRYNFHL